MLFRINGVDITLRSQGQAISSILSRLKSKRSFYICTLNLDHLLMLETDPVFKRVYYKTDLITADGQPIVYLARKEGVELQRTTGAGLVVPLCAAITSLDIPVYFIGTSDDVLQSCVSMLREESPALVVAGTYAPPFGFDPDSAEADAIIEDMRRSGAQLCFVGLGAPKQEIFCERAAAAIQGLGLIPVGAALEYVARAKTRAPEWMQQLCFEWLWRLASEPRRLAPRYL
jgi:exopolysaccharide biosynthesis WecB/TagA/CpsF family protein